MVTSCWSVRQAVCGGGRAGRGHDEPEGEAGQVGVRRTEDRRAAEGVRRQRVGEAAPAAHDGTDDGSAEEGRQTHLSPRRREDSLGRECRGG